MDIIRSLIDKKEDKIFDYMPTITFSKKNNILVCCSGLL